MTGNTAIAKPINNKKNNHVLSKYLDTYDTTTRKIPEKNNYTVGSLLETMPKYMVNPVVNSAQVLFKGKLPSKKMLEFNILESKFYLNRIFEEHIVALKDLNGIANLSYGWDGLDAEVFDRELIHSTAEFYINHLTEIKKVSGTLIESPVFDPVSDGSIDISWRGLHTRFLINCSKRNQNEFQMRYYGDNYNGENAFSGNERLKGVYSHMIHWMAEKLKKNM